MALRFDSASNRNEYQEYFLGGKDGPCVGLTTLPPSCTDSLEIWESQPEIRNNRNEYQEYFLVGKGSRCIVADNLTTFMCRLF
jgi:hypothetical protein